MFAAYPVALMGRVSTAINAVMLATVFVLQASIGWILDLWPRTPSDGWDPRGYSAALVLSIAVQFFVAARLAGSLRFAARPRPRG